MSESKEQFPNLPGRLMSWPESMQSKKRVEVFANAQTGEFTYKEYDGEQLINEVKNPKFITESAKDYMDSWKERAWQHKYWLGYPKFIKADQPNRQVVMAEARAVMETWFESGVTYDNDWMGMGVASAFGIRLYNNAPEQLHDILEIAYGKIRANILEWKRVPEYLRPQLLMLSPALPLASYGLKGENKAAFEDKVNGPSYGPVLWTEDKPLKERVELVINNWYDLQSHRLYGFISEIYVEENDRYKRPESWQAVDKYLELEQRLRQLGLDQAGRIEYYACRDGFQFTEVAEMLRSIGLSKSPEAVRKNFSRVKEKLSDVSRGT